VFLGPGCRSDRCVPFRGHAGTSRTGFSVTRLTNPPLMVSSGSGGVGGREGRIGLLGAAPRLRHPFVFASCCLQCLQRTTYRVQGENTPSQRHGSGLAPYILPIYVWRGDDVERSPPFNGSTPLYCLRKNRESHTFSPYRLLTKHIPSTS